MTVQEGFARLNSSLQEQIIGQPHLVERLLICLLSDGHLLVEGAPGLAKTKAINALAGMQFLQKKLKINNPWQQGPCRVPQWPPDARAASGCIFSTRTCMHGIVTEIPPQLVANFACFEW